MTTGKFKTIPIDRITVNRDQRQRRELADIDSLAESIARIGLINPPVITRDNVLVAGERRLTACHQLGWTSIPVQFAEDLDPSTLHLIELEENIKRLDISWQDRTRAILTYHNLRADSEDEWTGTATAEAIGLTKQAVYKHLLVAKALEEGLESVVNADKFSVAFGICERKRQRAASDTLSSIGGETIVVDGETSFTARPPAREKPNERTIPLLNVDFAEWAPAYAGVPFNFIHCDFPYGINADKHNQGNAAARGGYEDSAEAYSELLDVLASSMDNVVAESAHLMFWFSMEYYATTLDRLRSMGWSVLSTPLVWVKSDNSGILADRQRRPRNIYETAFFAARGDRYLVTPVANAFASPNTKDIHMSEKPRAMLQHFFRLFVDEYTIMLDPTCGSGNAVAVAEAMGAKETLGLEVNEEFYKLACENFYKETDDA